MSAAAKPEPPSTNSSPCNPSDDLKLLNANSLAELHRQIPSLGMASRLQCPRPVLLPTGVTSLDALVSGWPRGGLSEIYGSASSGRTSLCLAALRSATRQGESCALVDASDAFDPLTAQKTGVHLEQLLWVRCGSSNQTYHDSHSGNYAPSSGQRQLLIRNSSSPAAASVEQALRTTDLLLQSGGFGLVVMDLCDVPAELVRGVPLTSWFRLSRAVENTPTVLLLATSESCARTCASLVLRLEPPAVSTVLPADPTTEARLPSHVRLLRGLSLRVEVIRSRTAATSAVERKPAHPHTATWNTRTAWAG